MKRPAARPLTRGELIAGVGGAGLLVSTFLPWYSIGAHSVDAWEAFSVVDLILGAAAAAALSVAGCVLGRVSVSYPVVGSTLALLFGLIALILVVFRAADPAGGGSPAREVGLWLGLASSGGVVLGGYLGMQPHDGSAR